MVLMRIQRSSHVEFTHQAEGRSQDSTDHLSVRRIRAHALEGRLYREAVEAAASRCGLACEVLVEGEALPSAAVAVGKRPVEIKAATDAWGKALGPPWGAQEKAAALAAWVALAGR